MIGSITKGSDFGGCIRYALAVDEPGKEARLIYAEGVLSDTPQDIINGFECQRHLNQRVQHWVGHISLSYSPEDEDSAILTDDKMVKFALEYMERMGIKNTQFIIARHLDSSTQSLCYAKNEHPHCHIVFNRVDNDGKCVSDSWDYFRSNDICKELKLKYGLTFGEGRDKVKTHRLKGRDRAKQEVYIAVRDALKVAKDWTTFQRELAKSGVSLRKKYRRGTTIVEGLSFVKGMHKFKASEVAKKRKFSFANIDRILNENKNGRSQMVSTSSPAPRPAAAKAPKQEPSIASKVIEAGLEVLSEVIANSWDADATEVSIVCNQEDDVITIIDNGCGMIVEDINRKFLYVGYPKRKNGEARTKIYNRPVMGRKGIGKLSLLSIADSIKIFSKKEGEQNAFCLSREDIEREITSQNHVYSPAEIEFEDFDHETGTKIVIRKFKKKINRTSEFLRKRLARRFCVIGKNYGIVLNGSPITLQDRDFLEKSNSYGQWVTLPPQSYLRFQTFLFNHL